MKANLKTTASLGVGNAKLNVSAEMWHVRDNREPICLTWENHHGPLRPEDEEVPLLDRSYIEKAAAWHMYMSQLEALERIEKWEKAFTNLSTISELPPTS